MGGSVLITLLLGWFAIRSIRNMNREQELRREGKTESLTFIKYDAKTVRLLNGLSKIVAVVFLVSWFLAEKVWVEVGMIVLPAGLILIFLIVYHWCGKQYLKKLNREGYIIPERAADYGGVLENLPRTEIKQLEPETYNRRSKVLWIICLSAFLILLAIAAYFCYCWSFMKDNVPVALLILGVPGLLWLILALVFRKQMSNEKYKEDVEIDNYRKDRLSLGPAIVFIVILFWGSWGAILLADAMMKYVYNARVEASRDEVRNVHFALEQTYDEMLVLEKESVAGTSLEIVLRADWESSIKQLEMGVDITEWGVPQDIYQEKVAEYLGISDFAELKDDFSVAKGDAILYAELKDGMIRVSLPNLCREVNMPIIIYSEKESKVEK